MDSTNNLYRLSLTFKASNYPYSFYFNSNKANKTGLQLHSCHDSQIIFSLRTRQALEEVSSWVLWLA